MGHATLLSAPLTLPYLDIYTRSNACCLVMCMPLRYTFYLSRASMWETPGRVVPSRGEYIETERAVAALRFKPPCLFYLHRYMHTGLLHFRPPHHLIRQIPPEIALRRKTPVYGLGLCSKRFSSFLAEEGKQAAVPHSHFVL